MKRITRESLFESATDRFEASWHNRYNGAWSNIGIDCHSASVDYNRMVVARNADEIDAIFGGSAWTTFYCDGCGNFKSYGFALDEGEGAYICDDCIEILEGMK